MKIAFILIFQSLNMLPSKIGRPPCIIPPISAMLHHEPDQECTGTFLDYEPRHHSFHFALSLNCTTHSFWFGCRHTKLTSLDRKKLWYHVRERATDREWRLPHIIYVWKAVVFIYTEKGVTDPTEKKQKLNPCTQTCIGPAHWLKSQHGLLCIIYFYYNYLKLLRDLLNFHLNV